MQEKSSAFADASAKKAQEAAIRKRLLQRIQSVYGPDYTVYQIWNEINGNPFEINRKTLTSTLHGTGEINLFCVLALCRRLHINPAWLFSEPETEDSWESAGMLNPAEMSGGGAEQYVPLQDSSYYGRYYGYCYSQDVSARLIDTFELQISPVQTAPNQNAAHAQLILSAQSVQGDGTVQQTKRFVSGSPVLVKPNLIYMLLKNDLGDMLFVTFSYILNKSGKLWFRRGALSTQTREAARSPLLQSFVLFDHPIGPEHQKWIPGLLSFGQQSIHISKRKLDELMAKEKTVRDLYEHLGYIMEHNTEPYCLIHEQQILSSLSPEYNRNEAVAALSLIKSAATDPVRVFYPENSDYSNFSKTLSSWHSPPQETPSR